MIKAILFDLDGVLIEAKEWHFEALNRALLETSGFIITPEEHAEVYDGLPTFKKLEMLHNSKGLRADHFEQIKKLKKRYTYDIAKEKDLSNKIILDCIEQLFVDGYSMICCSNSINEFIGFCLKKMGIAPYFDTWYGNDDVLKPKPDPEMYLKAIEDVRYKPEECLIVEDNENGIKAAQASGCNLMIVSSPKDVYYENMIKEINKYK